MAPKEPAGPPIVAELGRPETPEETAARKAASSKRYRDSKTSLNLVVALVASLAIVLVTVMIVVRPAPPPAEPVDYAGIAAQVQRGYEATIASPALSEEWRSNSARIETGRDGVPVWYIGFVTPKGDFAAVTQGIDANPTWVAATLEGGFATGTTTVGQVTWDVYDRRSNDDIGNFAYAMTTVIGDSTLVLHGTADDDEFTELAEAVARSMAADVQDPDHDSTDDTQEAP